MEPHWIAGLMAAYFGLLIFVAGWTTKTSTNTAFFTGNRQSPWYVVSFGMIGASLSGVTFISIPGSVGVSSLSYLQMVLGYFVGYLVVAYGLLPVYYRVQRITIYSYLEERFGRSAYKTGAWLFLVSRMVGSAFRLFLVALVLQKSVFDSIGWPFWATTAVTLLLIWVYTYKGGIKTIVWTDTLQTLFLLAAVVWTVLLLYPVVVPDGQSLVGYWNENPLGRIFFFDNPSEPTYFWKQFVAGIFITIAMTGLDQDMMQKNLTCRSLPEAQKNMLWFSVVLIAVNALFLFLGLLLNDYAAAAGLSEQGDSLYPAIALQGHLPVLAAGIFVVGLIAAAYSSADSALAALTTSFSVDILEVDRMPEEQAVRTRRWVHVGVTVAMAVVIVLFQSLSNDSVVNGVFKAAGYTYGPLLGLFAFALFTRRGIRPWAPPIAALASPLLTYWIQSQAPLWWGYTFGFELILLNGGLAFLLLAAFSRRAA